MARKVRSEKQRRAAIKDGYCFGLVFPKEAYRDYLLSKWWKAKRQQKLLSVCYRCELCKSNLKLHVHHLHYCSLGRERNSDLQVLCEPCHKKQHPGWE